MSSFHLATQNPVIVCTHRLVIWKLKAGAIVEIAIVTSHDYKMVVVVQTTIVNDFVPVGVKKVCEEFCNCVGELYI